MYVRRMGHLHSAIDITEHCNGNKEAEMEILFEQIEDKSSLRASHDFSEPDLTSGETIGVTHAVVIAHLIGVLHCCCLSPW